MRVTGSRFGTTEGESREERQPDQGTSFPQISSQVSNLPFAGSRHQTNPAMYRFMRSQESVNPGGGDSLLLGVGFGGASVRGSPHSLSQLNSTHCRKSWPPPLPCWGAREREGEREPLDIGYIHPSQLSHSIFRMAPLPDRNSTNQGSQEGVGYVDHRLGWQTATKLRLPWLLGWPAVGPLPTPHPCSVSCSSRPENELDRPRWGPPAWTPAALLLGNTLIHW